jgi:hypothetical protein
VDERERKGVGRSGAGGSGVGCRLAHVWLLPLPSQIGWAGQSTSSQRQRWWKSAPHSSTFGTQRPATERDRPSNQTTQSHGRRHLDPARMMTALVHDRVGYGEQS